MLRMATWPGLKALLPLALRGQLGLPTVFRLHALSIPAKAALIEGQRVVTYGELNQRANRLASFLNAHGVGPGSKVMLVLRNSVAYVETAVAAAKMRVAAVPLSYRLTAAELAYVLADSRPTALVFHADLAPAVLGADPAGKGVRTLLAVDGDAPGCTPYERALGLGSDVEPPENPASAGWVVYTSGTTGRPKGAVRSFNAQNVGHLISLLRAVPLKHTDVHLIGAPLYHTLANGFATIHLGMGATIFLLPKFEPEAFLAAVERWRVTTTALVPTMIAELVALPGEVRRRYDTSSLRVVVSSGAALEHTLVQAFAEAYGRDLLYNLYGATEFGWVTIAGPADLLDRPHTIGRPVPGCELLLLDEQRREVPPGEVGELFVKSGLLVEAYHGNPKATRESRFRDYFTVGDLARRDHEGYLFLAGRKVDMVVSGGVNIYPAEIEAALLQHPAVLEVAVIGVPDERWGEALRAFVVLREGMAASEEDLQQFLRRSLAGYKVPKQYRFVPGLPKNPTGKVLKRELRETP
jgi:fatty-acyl-CoA synthase